MIQDMIEGTRTGQLTDEVAGTVYEWTTEWTEPPTSDLVMTHTGLVLTKSDELVAGAAGEATLVFRNRGGDVVRRTPVPTATDLHDLTLVQHGGEESLWIADTATRLYGLKPELDIRRLSPHGQVLEVDLDGRELRRLETPPVAVYESVGYRPTAVAVDESDHGGSGDIWVADGYGAHLLHRFDADGRYVQTLSGDEGGGRFREPHDVLIDRRGGGTEILVSDRVNHRIQVYDTGGSFLRLIGDGLLPGPTQMAISGELLVVTDLLTGRLTLIDSEDRVLGHLFAHPAPPRSWDDTPDAWPNARGDDGMITAANLVPGAFHTPHGVIAGTDGTLYVSEFAIGGRIAVITASRG